MTRTRWCGEQRWCLATEVSLRKGSELGNLHIGEGGTAQAAHSHVGAGSQQRALDNSPALLKSNYSNSLASNAGHCECKMNISTEQSHVVLLLPTGDLVPVTAGFQGLSSRGI